MERDIFSKQWIIENATNVCSQYDNGVLTIRGLHYQLVGLGMTNDIQHYKRVVSAMIDARWDGLIQFDQFSDLDRTMEGQTDYLETSVDDSVEEAKDSIRMWMRYYSKNRWENQEYYPEILIEKKALQGVFAPICGRNDIALGACKGYPSLTFLHDTYLRFQAAIDSGKIPIILYFGDYDPSGEDIPRSIKDNLLRFGVDVEIRRIALMRDQVELWRLPPAPVKVKDTRTATWNGIGQVELDAVKPEQIKELCEDAISHIFDMDLYKELMNTEKEERRDYRSRLVDFVKEINEENE